MNLPPPEDIYECDFLLRRAIEHRNRNGHDPFIAKAVPRIIDVLLDCRLELAKHQ